MFQFASDWLGSRKNRRAAAGTSAGRKGRSCRRSARLELEPLEDRRMLTTITVKSVADSGDDSLRVAIEAANNLPGVDTIEFDIDRNNPGVRTIALLSPLPTITEPVTIDGYSQAGATANTLAVGNNAKVQVVLSGLNAGAGADGLHITAGGSTVKGLVFNFFSSGITLSGGGGNKIEGNFIGSDPTGTFSQPTYLHGVRINGSSGNTVGGLTPAARNVISGSFAGNGITIDGNAANNAVQNNYIGLTASGLQVLSNKYGVVLRDAVGNTIGGAAAGARNVFFGNAEAAVLMDGAGTTGNFVQGNTIGLNALGTNTHPGNGVIIQGAVGNTVGGQAVWSAGS